MNLTKKIANIAVLLIASIVAYFLYTKCNQPVLVPVEGPDVVVRAPVTILPNRGVVIAREGEDGSITTTKVKIDDKRDVYEVVTIDSVDVALMDARSLWFPEFRKKRSRVLELATLDTTKTVITTLQRRSILSLRPGFSLGVSVNNSFKIQPSASLSVGRVGPFRPGAFLAYDKQEQLLHYGPEVSFLIRDHLDLASGYALDTSSPYLSLRYRF